MTDILLAKGYQQAPIRTAIDDFYLPQPPIPPKARFILVVDLGEIFFRSRVGGTKKIKLKSSENDQLTGHFQSFFFFRAFFFFFFRAFFSFFSLISPEKQ